LSPSLGYVTVDVGRAEVSNEEVFGQHARPVRDLPLIEPERRLAHLARGHLVRARLQEALEHERQGRLCRGCATRSSCGLLPGAAPALGCVFVGAIGGTADLLPALVEPAAPDGIDAAVGATDPVEPGTPSGLGHANLLSA